MKNWQWKTDDSVLTELRQGSADAAKARQLLASWRWPNGPVGPHCQNGGEKTISKLEAQATRRRGVRTGVYFCGACRRPFTVTVGTVLERSHGPFSKWLLALFLLGSAKKSVRANQIHRRIGVTYKTAWLMCHRLRLAMTPQSWDEAKLTGTVEVDETFVGPKAKPKTAGVARVERQGLARVKGIASVTQKNLGALGECVSKEAVVNTDEHPSYKLPLQPWKAHQAVNHARGEYERHPPDGSRASTNTAESFFSLLKRAIIGAGHPISQEHLARYANEFAFRWNTRQDTDRQRWQRVIEGLAGKRLTYRQVAHTLCVR